MLGEIPHLVEHRVTGNVANAAHDDIADFPFSVRANNRQEV
jgi:hypothetical protein